MVTNSLYLLQEKTRIFLISEEVLIIVLPLKMNIVLHSEGVG